MASPTPPARTDAALQASYEVVIVGSGVAASALAFALAHKHRLGDIAVLQPAATTAAVVPGPAILRASHAAPAMVRLAAAAAYGTLPRQLRAEMSPLQRPLLELAFTPTGIVRLTRLADTARHLGGKAWLVPPLEVRSHLPFARIGGERSVLGALFEPAATVFERRALARAFARGATARGVQIFDGMPVTEVLLDGEIAVGVRTAAAEVRAQSIVLAPEVALPRYPGADLPGLSTVADALLIDSEPAAPVFAAAVVARRFGALTQDEAAVTSLSAVIRGPASAARAALLAALVDAAPGLGGLFLRRQVKTRTLATLDGAPVAGRLKPGLHLFAGLGFEHAALALPAAEALANEIARGEPEPLLAPFAPSRFASGRLLAPPAEVVPA